MFSCGGKTEVHAAVASVFQEFGAVGKVVVLPVFQNKQSAGAQHFALKDESGQLRQFRQLVRRVSKYEVKTFVRAGRVAQGVGADQRGGIVMQGFEHTADKGSMLAVLFYADYFRAAAREEFERNAARAGKRSRARVSSKSR